VASPRACCGNHMTTIRMRCLSTTAAVMRGSGGGIRTLSSLRPPPRATRRYPATHLRGAVRSFAGSSPRGPWGCTTGAAASASGRNTLSPSSFTRGRAGDTTTAVEETTTAAPLAMRKTDDDGDESPGDTGNVVVPPMKPPSTTAGAASMTTMLFSVEGMRCGGCSAAVQKVL